MENSKKQTLVRTHGIRKEKSATIVPAAAKTRIAKGAYSRASDFDDQYFERMKKVTNSKDNDNSVRGIVLDRLRQNSVCIRKDSTAVACRKLNINLLKNSHVRDVDLFREGVGSVLHRLGRGDTAFDDQELFLYLRTAFAKSKPETDALISEIKAEKIAKHSLHVSIYNAKLKYKPKTSTFCSVTLLKNENINFATCNETNTKLTMLCGTQVPLFDYTTSFPLDTAKGCILLVAVWETKGTANFDIVNNDKRCLGMVELPLDAQPEGGSDDWYQIKSQKNDKEKGLINIVVKFRVNVDHDPEHSVAVHTKLLSKFLSCDYDGGANGLQGNSAYILELHITQKGLTSEERWLSEWTVRNTIYLKTNSDYGMLLGVLNKVLYTLNNDTSQLKPQQRSDLLKSFAGFIDQALEKYKNVVAEFPYTSSESINNLTNLNECVSGIVKCKAFYDIYINNTKHRICEAITANVQLWYGSYCEGGDRKKEDEEDVIKRIKTLTTIAKTIHLELSNENEIYPNLFTVLDIDFMSITLHEVDNLFSVELVRDITEVIKAMKHAEPEEELMNATLYLYVCVKEIKKQFVNMVSVEEEFTLLKYHSWFYNPIETWLKIIRIKQRARVAKAVELDKLHQCDDFVKYSTSVIDVETMNIELGDIYKVFDFPDESSAFSVVSKLTEQMCDSMVMLSERLEERSSILISSKHKKLAKDKSQIKDTILLETLCIVLNSMEQGLDTFTRLPDIMNFDQFTNPKNIDFLGKTIEDSRDMIKLKKAEILHYLCNQMQPKFDEAFKEYLKSLHVVSIIRDKKDSLEVLSDIILDELNRIFEWVNHAIFLKVITSLWSRVIQPRFLQQIELRPLKKDSFYIGLQNGFTNLAQLFVDEVPELRASIQDSDRFSHLCHVFQLLTNPIQDLLFRFYDEEKDAQRRQTSELGQVHLSAHFTTPSKNDTTLKVIITRCVALPKMDITTLCDAVVHVLVQPIGAINFSHIKQRKTTCVKKNLNPEFNQSFDIPLHIEDVNVKGACLQLTVWDRDTFSGLSLLGSADDLVGEVLLPLRDIPSQVPREFICSIQYPTGVRTPCYEVISHRVPYDRHAATFIKYRQYLEKSIGKRSEMDGV